MDRRHLRLRRLLACSAATLVSFSCGAAYAQDASSSDAAATDQQGPDIIVTALKRETRLQETPLSISAISGNTLLDQGASSAVDIVRQIPGLNITEGNTAQRRITIRGVQSGGESTVGLYLGETPVSGPNSATSDPSSMTPDLNLFDVARVEVLRGPQGTLYGSGSMSGTFKVVYNDPSSSKYEGAFDGVLSTIKGGGINYASRAMINVPIVDGAVGFRAVGYYDRRAGFVDNVVLHQNDVNSARSYGGRFMLGLTPVSRLKINATAIVQEQTSYDSSSWYPALGDYKTDNAHKQPFPNSFRLYNLRGEYDFGFATFTASGSRYTWHAIKYIDGTRSAINSAQRASYCSRYFGISGTCSAAQKTAYADWIYSILPLSGYQPMEVGSWVWEGRLSSNKSTWIDWTVGVFHEARKDAAVSSTIEADPVTGLAKFPIVYNFSRSIAVDLKQTAFFGEATLRPFKGLSVTGGVRRYSYDKSSVSQVLSTSYINASVAGPPTTKSDDASGWVSKVNVAYEPNRNILFYAQRSEGFRPGGINNTPGLPADLVPYNSDSLVNYEAGIKTSWFDRKVTFNVSAYRIDWSNMQITASIPSFSFITNVGKSRIQGVEVETTAQPVPGLMINGNFAYQNGKLLADQRIGTIEAPGRKGDRIPYEPDFTAAVGAEYNWGILANLDGLLRLDVTYTGGSYSEFRPTSIYYEKMGDYALVNFRAGVGFGGWKLAAFVNNLFDAVGRVKVTSGVLSEQATFSTTPRTVGLNLRRNF